jgi:hypothetical protein
MRAFLRAKLKRAEPHSECFLRVRARCADRRPGDAPVIAPASDAAAVASASAFDGEGNKKAGKARFFIAVSKPD